MNFELLAEAAGADPMISGAWVTGVIVAIIGAMFAGFKGGRAGRVKVEPQPLAVEITSTLATKKELEDLEGRIVAELKKLEGALNGERSVARIANGNLHARIDKTVESLAEVRGELSQINANLNRLVDLAMKHTPIRRTP